MLSTSSPVRPSRPDVPLASRLCGDAIVEIDDESRGGYSPADETTQQCAARAVVAAAITAGAVRARAVVLVRNPLMTAATCRGAECWLGHRVHDDKFGLSGRSPDRPSG